MRTNQEGGREGRSQDESLDKAEMEQDRGFQRGDSGGKQSLNCVISITEKLEKCNNEKKLHM